MQTEAGMSVVETPVLLTGGEFTLYGVLHRPEGGMAPLGCVCCAPFAEEKKGAHRLLVDLARALARRGVPVLRFDYRGTGDSAGAFTDFTLAGAIADISQAVSFLQARCGVPRVGLLGVRLGAALAAQALPAIGMAGTTLVLWEPVTNGRRFLQLSLRQKRIREMMTAAEGGERADEEAAARSPATPGTPFAAPDLPPGIDCDGYWVTTRLQEELEALVFPEPVAGLVPGRLLGLSVNAAGRVSRELEGLGTAYREAGAAVELAGVVAEPFWSLQDPVPVPELVRLTADWLAQEARPPLAPPALEEPRETEARIALPEGVEEPVVFTGGQHRLWGVLTRPAADGPPATGLVTLGGWAGTRIGPHALFVSLARRAAAAGCATLRFDFGGRGDSEGELEAATRATMIADAVGAARFLREQTGCRRVIFVGLCAGAQVAIGAVAAGANADGLILWSAPVSEVAAEEKAVIAKRRHFLGEYARKLFRAQTWRKLVTGKLQPRQIARVVSGQQGRAAEDDRQVDLKAAAKLADFEGPLLFVYGTHDPVTPVALPYYRRLLARRQSQVTVHQIAGANHSYYGTAWREEVLAHTLAWLREQFP